MKLERLETVYITFAEGFYTDLIRVKPNVDRKNEAPCSVQRFLIVVVQIFAFESRLLYSLSHEKMFV